MSLVTIHLRKCIVLALINVAAQNSAQLLSNVRPKVHMERPLSWICYCARLLGAILAIS